MNRISLTAKGYSLWLKPEEGKVFQRFSNLINRLAEEYGTSGFAPHITLLGEILESEEKITEKVKQLVINERPFILNLREVDHEDILHRALFVRVEKTAPLLELYNRAKEIFGMREIPAYMPHLSLLYGSLPIEVKEKIIAGIGRDQQTEFTVTKISLFKTEGEVSLWRQVKEFPFHFHET